MEDLKRLSVILTNDEAAALCEFAKKIALGGSRSFLVADYGASRDERCLVRDAMGAVWEGLVRLGFGGR